MVLQCLCNTDVVNVSHLFFLFAHTAFHQTLATHRKELEAEMRGELADVPLPTEKQQKRKLEKAKKKAEDEAVQEEREATVCSLRKGFLDKSGMLELHASYACLLCSNWG